MWLLGGVLLAGACSEASPGDARNDPLSPAPSAAGRRASSPEMRAHTGLSHLPEAADPEAFAASLRRHYPAQLRARGLSGATLVDVHVDAEGRVLDVDVVPRPARGTHRAVLQDGGISRVMDFTDRPELGPAAQAAIRETRFLPGLKDGKAVPYKLRMTVQFTP
jgi:hypothetical protein